MDFSSVDAFIKLFNYILNLISGKDVAIKEQAALYEAKLAALNTDLATAHANDVVDAQKAQDATDRADAATKKVEVLVAEVEQLKVELAKPAPTAAVELQTAVADFASKIGFAD